MNKSKWILLVLKTFRLRSFIRNLFIRRNMQFNVCEAVVFIKDRLLWICKISMDCLTKCITRKRLNTWRWHNDSMYITKHFHVIFYAFAIQYIWNFSLSHLSNIDWYWLYQSNLSFVYIYQNHKKQSAIINVSTLVSKATNKTNWHVLYSKKITYTWIISYKVQNDNIITVVRNEVSKTYRCSVLSWYILILVIWSDTIDSIIFTYKHETLLTNT